MDFKITDKMKRFVLAYNGNAAEAMRMAGYVGTTQQLEQRGNDLLKDPHIAEAIRERSKQLASNIAIIAKTEEIQAWWSELMRNNDPYELPETDAAGATVPKGNIPLQHRISASEKLAKAQGMFIERIDINQNISITDMVEKSYSIPDEDVEKIRLRYNEQIKKKQEAIVMKKAGDAYEAEEQNETEESLDGLF